MHITVYIPIVGSDVIMFSKFVKAFFIHSLKVFKMSLPEDCKTSTISFGTCNLFKSIPCMVS